MGKEIQLAHAKLCVFFIFVFSQLFWSHSKITRHSSALLLRNNNIISVILQIIFSCLVSASLDTMYSENQFSSCSIKKTMRSVLASQWRAQTQNEHFWIWTHLLVWTSWFSILSQQLLPGALDRSPTCFSYGTEEYSNSHITSQPIMSLRCIVKKKVCAYVRVCLYIEKIVWLSVGTADGQDSPSRLYPLIGPLSNQPVMLKLVSTEKLNCIQTLKINPNFWTKAWPLSKYRFFTLSILSSLVAARW